MTIKYMEPKSLTLYSWGDGIGDLRYFVDNITMPKELEAIKKSSHEVQTLTLENAVKSLDLTMAKATPGIYFAGNPHSGTYGKWNMALQAAGFKRVPGCALNRVWGGWESYRGPKSQGPSLDQDSKEPWESPDGYSKWIHAFYHIVPGLTRPIKFDFTAKTRNLDAPNGDVDLKQGAKGSLWHINYMGGRHIKDVGGKARWCPNFARLSKSCGIALGYGLPECGKELSEEFYTISAQEDTKKWPKGWTVFEMYGGMAFAHNLKMLDTAQLKCPHKMEI